MSISPSLHPRVDRPAAGPSTSARRAIAAIILMLVGVVLLVGGGITAALGSALPAGDGYVTGSSSEWRSPGYAVRSEASVDLVAGQTDLPGLALDTLRATADPETDNGVFIGVARTTDVDRYLRGVAHSTVEVPLVEHDGAPVAAFVDGGSPRVAPTDATFWIAFASGQTVQTVTWTPQDVDLTLVVMNGEGTTPVAADVSLGGELDDLELWGLLGLGLGLAVIGLGTALTGAQRHARAADHLSAP